MELLIVVVAVLVIGVAALVAAGGLGEMPAEPVRDRYTPDLPEEGLTAADLERIRFQVVPRGYDMAAVDALIARLADELDRRDTADRAVTTLDAPEIGPQSSTAPQVGG